MAQITAAAVNALRQATDAPMMQCKAALVEADGDMEAAKVILRKKLGNKVAGKTDRVTAEGLIFGRVSADKTRGAVIELNCETDFVAKNDAFRTLGKTLVDRILAYEAGTVPTSLEAFLADATDGQKVGDFINEAAGPIGERVVLGRFDRFGAPAGNVVATYVHNPGGSGDEGGKIGVLVELTGADADTLAALGKDIAQHIAAANPQYLTDTDVEQGILDREREIAAAQAAADPKMAGKPAQAIEAMVNGRVRKFLEETVLLKQAYVRDPAKNIESVVKAVPGASLVRFLRFRVGETQADAAATESEA